MLTLLLYVLIVGLVAALLFLLASALFGRSEELGPLPEGTTATVLPVAGISGSDVRALRFQQVFRGYKAGEVDWALARLAGRIDELETELADARAYVAATAPERPLAAANLTKANSAGPDGAGTPAPRRVPGATPLPQVLPGEPATPDTPEAVSGTVATDAAADETAAPGEGPAGERNGETGAR
nr:DivIVA domain-containing protein [Nocardia yamanashiensis]